jgi:hypothetical protein
MKLKPKHEKLIAHFELFVDRRWHPDYKPTHEDKVNFIKFQSYGGKSISEEEFKTVKPLVEAQERKEQTIKGLVEDIALFWSRGFGWRIPVMHDIDCWLKTRHEHKDRIFIRALIKIVRNIEKNGVISFIESYPDFSREFKNKIFAAYAG